MAVSLFKPYTSFFFKIPPWITKAKTKNREEDISKILCGKLEKYVLYVAAGIHIEKKMQ